MVGRIDVSAFTPNLLASEPERYGCREGARGAGSTSLTWLRGPCGAPTIVLLPELLLRMEVLDAANAGPVCREYEWISVACDGECDETEAEGGVEETEPEELLLKRLA